LSLRVLITRSDPDPIAARVRARGGEPILAPVLNIRDRAADVGLDGVQALLFTSANGVRAFARQTHIRTTPALCVGDATAQTARDAGFGDVRSADGDAQSLVHHAARTLSRNAGLVVHVSGADVSTDLAAALAECGFSTERRIFYEAVAAATLPRNVVARLEAKPPALDLVLLHSRRAAQTFCTLARAAAPGATGQLVAACLSPGVAEAARESRWRRVIVASAPREEALLAAAFASPLSEA
jgi:uroporphyrinogen-III synthase